MVWRTWCRSHQCLQTSFQTKCLWFCFFKPSAYSKNVKWLKSILYLAYKWKFSTSQSKWSFSHVSSLYEKKNWIFVTSIFITWSMLSILVTKKLVCHMEWLLPKSSLSFSFPLRKKNQFFSTLNSLQKKYESHEARTLHWASNWPQKKEGRWVCSVSSKSRKYFCWKP